MRSELVDRQRIMESLTNEYNRRRDDGLKLAYIEKAVNEVPAARPAEFINKEILISQLEYLEKINKSGVPEWVYKVIRGI